MEVIINRCYGGYGLSHKAVMKYAELKGIKLYPYIDDATKRVYGKEATFDNPRICLHYSTKPASNEKELNDNYFSERDIERTDKILIQVIKELGEEANSRHAKLKIVYIPDGIDYEIDEYDGIETIREKHRTWS